MDASKLHFRFSRNLSLILLSLLPLLAILACLHRLPSFPFPPILVSLLPFSSRPIPPPPPLLPIPTARQLTRQRAELAAFFHVGVNTFTDREWGTGAESPTLFAPTALDARQWVAAVQAAGVQLVVLTAKHHDGFCLWPSALTNHSVRSSPWKAGQGDVVADVAAAARAAGMGFGVYLSPWDRHDPAYEAGAEAYNAFYEGQLREVLTRYGPIAEAWLDGAKGDDCPMTYHTATWLALIRQLQPGAAVFSAQGPDVRWVGNERGEAGQPCWGMVNGSQLTLEGWDTDYLYYGDVAGTDWIPPECDVSIRPGWFWHPSEHPKPLSALLSIYLACVGRGGSVLLNVPPNTTGLLHGEDVQRLGELGRALEGLFREEVSGGAQVWASSVYGCDVESGRRRWLLGGGYGRCEYGPENMLRTGDGKFWAAEDGVVSAVLHFDLGQLTTFHVARLEEPVALGQRIKSFSVEVLHEGGGLDNEGGGADAQACVSCGSGAHGRSTASHTPGSLPPLPLPHVDGSRKAPVASRVHRVLEKARQWWLLPSVHRSRSQGGTMEPSPTPCTPRSEASGRCGEWRLIANGTTVGRKWLVRLAAVRARHVRVVIHDARAAPLLSVFALYRSEDEQSND